MRAEKATDRPPDRDGDPRELDDLADRLQTRVNRRLVLGRLDKLFVSGAPPDPLPEGFLPGRLLATSTWPWLDAAGQRLATLWMPWKGKAFSPASSMGLNRFARSARTPLKIVFPSYSPEFAGPDRVEAFPFRTRIAPGALDPNVQVLKIDYDFEANPAFIIRRILDELVQVGPGRYLGKVLFRIGDRFHPIGFFSLRSDSAS